MKTKFSIIVLLVLVLTLGLAMPTQMAKAISGGGAGGTVTTGAGAWGGGSGVIFPDTFDLTEGALTVYVMNVDMTQSRDQNWGCAPYVYPPPAPTFTTVFQSGITNQTSVGPWINPRTSAWQNLTNIGYYLGQQWYADLNNQFQGPSFGWNTPFQGGPTPNGGWHCTGDAEYDTFDLKTVFTDLGPDLGFQVTAYQRVHKTTDIFANVANQWYLYFDAPKYQNVPEDAVVKTAVRPFVFVGNMGYSAGGGTISWGNVIAVQNQPTNVWVDDDWAGSSYEQQVGDGHIFGIDAFAHPQDAVNAISPGGTILVYPGTYGSRYFVCPWAPGCSGSDNNAPALIVYKDDLTIKSVEGPANTIIQSTHVFWSNAIAVENSTAGGIKGISGWNPSAVIIVADNVTIDGFTLHRPFNCLVKGDCFNNTAGVFIGSKAAGYTDFLGQANGATVQNNIFSDVWHAVYMWHSSDNKILNNTVAALTTDHWAAISSYDGGDNLSIGLGSLSENNLIANNTLANKGISVGAWAPSDWTSAAGDVVACNKISQVGVAYAHGPVLAGGNTGGFWQSNTDKVLNITGISYTGDTVVPSGTSINLKAQLAIADSSADGSGVVVTFSLDGVALTPTTTTVSGGGASTTATLPVGVHEVGAAVEIYPGCTVTSATQFLVIFDATAGFVTGGGWIDSPAGAYAADPTLTGKATFGFVSKYKKGANVPDGTTAFQFKAGDLNFSSTSYQWLVVAGTKAQFKGVGTINSAGNYGFMLTATDGTPDKFRIKIWDIVTGNVIYDNMPGAADGDNLTTVLAGGSIVIHK